MVSIHAPRFREAMPAVGEAEQAGPVVSIHAPRFREAMQDGTDFNDLHAKVSIHAPRFREAMPRQDHAERRPFHHCFNPRPPFPGGDASR